MQSLLERIEENRLDALYLFINETLRDENEYANFFEQLITVLPHNWSIQRVELGHEFLSMCVRQDQLFDILCHLESLKTLIISDGYVPRKDNGTVHTNSLLQSLPLAKNLTNLDLQRLELQNAEQVDLLTNVFESLSESLEDIRITGLHLGPEAPGLDEVIETCFDMSNLRSLSLGSNAQTKKRQVVTPEKILELCQNTTTLQDLALRNMNMDDDMCRIIAKALKSNTFLTSLDIRQNETITNEGYSAILTALERNYDLWCTVMVDNESFQGKFSSLIELNQANRGDLIRNPTREKLANFIEDLSDHPTALWYFFTIHDQILYPLAAFISWKSQIESNRKQQTPTTTPSASPPSLSQQPGSRVPTSLLLPNQNLLAQSIVEALKKRPIHKEFPSGDLLLGGAIDDESPVATDSNKRPRLGHTP